MKTYSIVYLNGEEETHILDDDWNMLYSTLFPNTIRIYKGNQLMETKKNIKRYKLLNELPRNPTALDVSRAGRTGIG